MKCGFDNHIVLFHELYSYVQKYTNFKFLSLSDSNRKSIISLANSTDYKLSQCCNIRSMYYLRGRMGG